ncbi:MAG: inorganic diphosphatase [Acidimicrobiales bacterium]
MEFDVVVEIPKGSRNKYEFGEDGRIHLDRTLYTSTVYPTEYGYIDATLGEDGDPFDAMVICEEPTFPGCVIRARPVAMFRMKDEKGPDDKVVTVPVGDPRSAAIHDVSDLSDYDKDLISHFFSVYKALEPGKFVEVIGWESRSFAESSVTEAFDRANNA